jgi:hypothetical protein
MNRRLFLLGSSALAASAAILPELPPKYSNLYGDTGFTLRGWGPVQHYRFSPEMEAMIRQTVSDTAIYGTGVMRVSADAFN